MFARKAYQQLLNWKHESQGTTAMLIKGARRVGKSVLAQEFANNEYKKSLLIDFSRVSPEVRELFTNQRADIDTFFRYLFAYYNFTPIERNTLIIFDEVQLCPQARGFIKHLVADGRYDYIETGSLISIRKNVEGILIPSEEESIALYPLDFEEFLWATDARPLAEIIQDSFNHLTPLPQALHRKAENALREYMLVGGMPQVVQTYVDNNSFQAADRQKRIILELYRNDIVKYGDNDISKLSAIFHELPAQLSKHEKKFKLSALNRDARIRDYESAFFWLADAGLVNMCFNSTDPNVGLGLNLDQSSFKCYMFDTGLLITQALADNIITSENVYRDILSGKLNLNEGMITENLVSQLFVAGGHQLFFYSQSDSQTSTNRMEIDFLLSKPYVNAAGKYRISPVEVKSSKRFSTVSLDKFKRQFDKRVGTEYILSPKDMQIGTDRVYLPLYMAGLL